MKNKRIYTGRFGALHVIGSRTGIMWIKSKNSNSGEKDTTEAISSETDKSWKNWNL